MEGSLKARHAQTGYGAGYLYGSSLSAYPEAQEAAKQGAKDAETIAAKYQMRQAIT